MRFGEMVVRMLLAGVALVGVALYAVMLVALAAPMFIAACVQYLVQLGEFAPAPVPGLRLKPS